MVRDWESGGENYRRPVHTSMYGYPNGTSLTNPNLLPSLSHFSSRSLSRSPLQCAPLGGSSRFSNWPLVVSLPSQGYLYTFCQKYFPFPGLGDILVAALFPLGAWAPETSERGATLSSSERQHSGHIFQVAEINRLLLQPAERARNVLKGLSLLLVTPNLLPSTQWQAVASFVIASRAKQLLREQHDPRGELAALHYAEAVVANVPRAQIIELLQDPDAVDPFRQAFLVHFNGAIAPLLQQAWHASRHSQDPQDPVPILFEQVVNRLRTNLSIQLGNPTVRPRRNSAPAVLGSTSEELDRRGSPPSHLPAFPAAQLGGLSQVPSTRRDLDDALRDFRLGSDPDEEDAFEYDMCVMGIVPDDIDCSSGNDDDARANAYYARAVADDFDCGFDGMDDTHDLGS